MIKMKFSILLLFSIITSSTFSQISTSSPYSRYGLGILNDNTLAYQSALGGSSVALYNSDFVNSSNPATYSAFKAKSFLFSTGLSHLTTQMQTTDLTQITNNSSFSHITLGFPLSKSIFVSSGFLPYSNIGYVLEDSETIEGIGDIDYNYTGDGGISNFYIGTSVKLHKNLSVGVNAAYLFGGLNRNKEVLFNNNSIFNANSLNKINLKGYFYQFGLLFNKDLTENHHFTFGISANNNSEISAKRTILSRTFELNSTQPYKDTVKNSVEWGTMILPQQISAGFSFAASDKWLVVGNYSTQNWSDYRLFEETDLLENSMKISGGLQYVPDSKSVNSYWKRVNYRMGTSYNKSYLQLRGNQLEEKTISFGLGLPVKKSRTNYDLSVEMGEKGTINDSLIKERFIRFNLGVTFDGIWFVKRKYD